MLVKGKEHTMRELLLVALVLACPVMMVLMMRGGHGHQHGHARRHQADNPAAAEQASTEELRRRRDELDRSIDEREREEADAAPPVGTLR